LIKSGIVNTFKNRHLVKNDINHIKRFEGRNIARLMGCVVVLAFIAGIIVDVDHPLARFLGIHSGRFLHPYFAIGGVIFVGIGLVLVIACLCRYLWIRFLRKHSS